MFNTLLALNPNLKEVIDTISPFDFVFKFSTMENLIKIKKYSATTQDYISINAGTLIISESRIDNLKNKIGIPLNSTIVSVSTGQSAGYCEYCTYNYESDTAIVGHIVPLGNSRTVVINVAYI